jgi:hypothetical protein
LLSLANRANCRRLLPGTEITTNPAPPNREGKFGKSRGTGFALLRSLTFRRTTLGNGLQGSLPSQYLLRDVKATVARTPFQQVGIPVIARANDIQILLLIAGSQTARTSPVAVTSLIDEQALYKC